MHKMPFDENDFDLILDLLHHRNTRKLPYQHINQYAITGQCTLKCLSIGTLKTIDFPFVPNGKLMVLGVPI